MNEFVKVRDNLDKETAQKVKKLIKKYKIAQDDTIKSVSAVIFQNIGDDGVYILSDKVIAELKDGITKRMNEFSAEETEFINKVLEDGYIEAAEKTAALLDFKPDWKILRKEFVDMAVNTPIAGERFSERIWKNQNDLANRIYSDVLECVRTGKRPAEIARNIKKDFGSSAYSATRLVNTELARTVNDAQKKIYQESGVVQKVLYTATLEGNTCDDCAALDGKEFELNNAPQIPQHPNCRCCLVPVVDKWKPTQRADNETKENIDYKDYETWKNGG